MGNERPFAHAVAMWVLRVPGGELFSMASHQGFFYSVDRRCRVTVAIGWQALPGGRQLYKRWALSGDIRMRRVFSGGFWTHVAFSGEFWTLVVSSSDISPFWTAGAYESCPKTNAVSEFRPRTQP